MAAGALVLWERCNVWTGRLKEEGPGCILCFFEKRGEREELKSLDKRLLRTVKIDFSVKSPQHGSSGLYSLAVGVGTLIALVVIAVVVWRIDSSCPRCPDQWFGYRNSCYFFSKMKKDWNSSQASCSAEGSHLLVINDAKKMHLFLEMHIGYHWIGLRNSTGSGWTWEDGSKLNNTKVISNSPVQHCGVLVKGALHASSCAVDFPWICEKSPK
ncbi:killer cell lectin-like receptor subfamily G member 1 isoform X2 [Mauremys reevesii]|uniref:killer cell lectin-like receptor subfamily G member 1 isoform X2 n=1 Tax=Mauremys reevesii TaxID=260615 RepID=UPI00193FE81C|nr:killer cell lectin-like receptor subfamily G member 1 isoform X2 [Mauremys reevesii]